MKITFLAAIASAFLAAACSDVHTPGQASAPLPPKPTPGAQARIVLLAASRSDQQLDVSAQVLDGNGAGIPAIDVAFTITGGTVTPALAKTDATGTVKAVALVSGQATLSATTGALTEKVTVIGGAIPLSVNLSTNGTVTIGTANSFSANVTGTAIGGAFSYVFSYGDGTSETSATQAITHTYAKSGVYSANVRVTDGSGRTAQGFVGVQVNDPPPTPAPTPTPAAALVATLTCTAVASPGNTSCNVNLTYGGSAVSVINITRIDWDWGDGTAVETGLPASAAVRTHPYAHPGAYTVLATVTANVGTDGSKGPVTASKAITVN